MIKMFSLLDSVSSSTKYKPHTHTHALYFVDVSQNIMAKANPFFLSLFGLALLLFAVTLPALPPTPFLVSTQ